MDICFSNNAANTNTQQSPPFANFWLKQIKANTYKTEGYRVLFLQEHEPIHKKKQLAHRI